MPMSRIGLLALLLCVPGSVFAQVPDVSDLSRVAGKVSEAAKKVKAIERLILEQKLSCANAKDEAARQQIEQVRAEMWAKASGGLLALSLGILEDRKGRDLYQESFATCYSDSQRALMKRLEKRLDEAKKELVQAIHESTKAHVALASKDLAPVRPQSADQVEREQVRETLDQLKKVSQAGAVPWAPADQAPSVAGDSEVTEKPEAQPEPAGGVEVEITVTSDGISVKAGSASEAPARELAPTEE